MHVFRRAPLDILGDVPTLSSAQLSNIDEAAELGAWLFGAAACPVVAAALAWAWARAIADASSSSEELIAASKATTMSMRVAPA